MNDKYTEVTLTDEEIRYLNEIFGGVYKCNDENEKNALRELSRSLNESQKELLNNFLHLRNKRIRIAGERSFVEGFKKGLHIGLNYKRPEK